MIRKITLTAVLILTVAMVGALAANARIGRHALRGMAAGMCNTLTDEQRGAIHEKVAEMREAGATREEIRTAVAEMLTEYRVEVPEEWFSRKGNGYYLCADLTDEQRAALREKVVEMKEVGTTREEMRTVVAEMLTEYGIEVPEDWVNRPGRGKRGMRRGLKLCPLAPIADLAMIDAEVAAAPQASPQQALTSTTWGKVKKSR